jgi:hypothetical protein
MAAMMDAAKPRWYRPTPDRLVLVLLATEVLLWLSQRYGWFGFDQRKGWAALIAVTGAGMFLLLMFLWFLLSLVFRWWFQFSIRSLLVLMLVVA